MADALLRQTEYADFRITVRNQQALIQNFQRLDDDMRENVRHIVDFWGHAIQADAIDRAPFAKEPEPPHHPGFLKAHIEVRFTPSHLGFEVGCWAEPFDAIGENLYAIFMEYGTSQVEAQPFLNPAYQWGKPQFENDLVHFLKRIAQEYGAPGSG